MFGNQRFIRVPVFDEDPHNPGRSLFEHFWAVVQGFRTHPYAPEKSDPSITFFGYAQSPQDFRGVAQLQAGTVPYRNDGSAFIDSGLVEGPMGDPARRIFAQRLARRTASGGSA